LATKFKIPTANFQNDVRGDALATVFPRSSFGQWNKIWKEKPTVISNIQLKFLFRDRVQSEAFNAGVVRSQHGRVLP
jgi:hypothetical protein